MIRVENSSELIYSFKFCMSSMEYRLWQNHLKNNKSCVMTESCTTAGNLFDKIIAGKKSIAQSSCLNLEILK